MTDERIQAVFEEYGQFVTGKDCALIRAIAEAVAPRRKPLLASEIVTMYAECPTSDNDMIEFARAIEAAHGIKENT